MKVSKKDWLVPFKTGHAPNGDYVRIKIYERQNNTYKFEPLITWWEIRNHRMTYGGTCWGTDEFTDLPKEEYGTFAAAVDAIERWLQDNPPVSYKGVDRKHLIITTGVTTNWQLPATKQDTNTNGKLPQS